MSRKKSLAAIGADRDGNPIDTLYAIRERVGRALDETTSARDVAALARQFASLTADITEAEGRGSG